jgi:DNA-binding MarR family transcriptional regulator
MTFDQRATIGFQAAQLGRLVAERLRKALAPLGLQPAQAAALIEIGAKPGLTQKQLVERLEVEQPGVARTVSGLEAAGWVRKEARPGRSFGLFLTDRAAGVVSEAARISSAVDQLALGGLSRTERAHLIDALDELIGALKAG